MSTENGDFDSQDEWYSALKKIAAYHSNSSAVRDREGWCETWETMKPEEAYYEEYPEHKEGGDSES